MLHLDSHQVWVDPGLPCACAFSHVTDNALEGLGVVLVRAHGAVPEEVVRLLGRPLPPRLALVGLWHCCFHLSSWNCESQCLPAAAETQLGMAAGKSLQRRAHHTFVGRGKTTAAQEVNFDETCGGCSRTRSTSHPYSSKQCHCQPMFCFSKPLSTVLHNIEYKKYVR